MTMGRVFRRAVPVRILVGLLAGVAVGRCRPWGKSAIRFRMHRTIWRRRPSIRVSTATRSADLRQESRRGIRTTQARWIDSICYHAMLGEVLYHQGRNAEALAEFDQACQVILAYPNWLLQVQFQPQPPRPDLARARRPPPWGQSSRSVTLGQFSETEQVFIGELDPRRALQQGGVVRTPMLWRINVVEIIRTSALAIRRRSELLGPLATHDPISKELSTVFARGNLSPPNHWSSAWIDVLRGVAQAGAGKLDEADMLLSRSLTVDGQFDHPLTCVVLLEQGRIAMARGDSRGRRNFWRRRASLPITTTIGTC